MIKIMNSINLILSIYFSFTILLAQSAPPTAAVAKIPGVDAPLASKHFAGYVPIDKGKKFYYYYVLSERNPAKDPVVLWLNGGPGCSSLGAFVYEHGPFSFDKTGKIHLNPYSWSKVSNVIYLDSPVGVGMSYSANKADYTTSDTKTSIDSHNFLLELYPEHVSNPFFIAGESYAGIYVPNLSDKVVKGLTTGAKPILNFKGYIVGNGVTDKVFDGNAYVPFQHGMGLISDDLFQEVTKACNGQYYDTSKPVCNNMILKVGKVVEGLNGYNILEPCFHGPSKSKIRLETSNSKSNLPASFRRLGQTERPLPVGTRMFGRAWPFRAPVKAGYVSSWPEPLDNLGGVPCVDEAVATKWLNNEAVRKAIHADPIPVAGNWMLCSNRITYNREGKSMIPLHKDLTSRGYRLLIFSGDHDMRVPFTGSEAWTRSLGYKITDEWRKWLVDGQVAGYVSRGCRFTQGYDHNLTFLTIKGSGHTVPEYKPKEALAFYTRWLDGKPV